MVAVFKTDVSSETKAKSIIKILKTQLTECKINFDLEDCDKILRIEGENIKEQIIVKLLLNHKTYCEVLI
jgi:hypothetical protein